MLIDFHTHVGDSLGRNIEHVRAHIKRYGGGKSVLLPLEAGKATAAGTNQNMGTKFASEAFKQYSDEVIPFCNVDPLNPDVLDQIRNYHATGIFHGLGEYKVTLDCDHPASMAIYNLCGDLGWPVLIHFEYGQFAHNFEDFGQVLKACPKTNFIGHAISWWSNISSQVNSDPNSPNYEIYPTGPIVSGGLTDHLLKNFDKWYADLSARSGYFAMLRDPEYVKSFLKRYRKKILWGSDCPCVDGKGSLLDGGYRDCLSGLTLPLLRDYCESESHFEDITFGNAKFILGI